MNIRDLRYVVAIAEERHFGRAAERCNVSQPALSGQIRKLEDYLGVILFERTNRSVQTTPVGLRIVEQARQLLHLSDDIVATAQSAKSPYSGAFRLGMISTIGPYLSPLILGAIREVLPDLSLILVEGLTTDLEARVAAGDLDGAVIATLPVEAQLSSRDLYEEPFWVAMSSSHPLAGEASLEIDAVKHEELLLLSDGHCLRDQVLDVCHRRSGDEKINTFQTSIETLLSLVAAGRGVTLAPALTLTGRRRTDEGLVFRAQASGTAGRVVNLVFRRTYPREELINRIAKVIQDNVPLDLVHRCC